MTMTVDRTSHGFCTKDNSSHDIIPAKRVSFSQTSNLIVVERWTDEEARSAWFSTEEIERFRENKRVSAKRLIMVGAPRVIEHLIVAVVKGDSLTDFPARVMEHYCGLEASLVPRVMKSLLSLKASRTRQILHEQDRQLRTKEKNWELLAYISLETAPFARDWARITAILNAMD
ncbi:hypothetical protein HJC23_011959 [Cyclotella cryptica]|uniref:Uncharacterized protein n=1 Tax=Cyclotella cryptica TaxID=29204 RepID=A0ABD3QX74_9STRA|eukprot:CCRYP_003005-RA/>CCRYP_003005-RA protein AED:0.04 eAED:0.04 QI:413/1/1/1/0/0/2/243/173